MGKAGTWAATGAVAAALAGVGAVVDGRARSRPLATLVGATCALAYLVGTFLPRARVFGSCVDTEPIAGTFALTFDDGPDPRHTPAISRALAARGHRATFFVLGRAVRAHPELAAQVVADGHELACHGDDHRLLAFASPREVRRQIAATERAVRGAVGRVPARFFRPPHGVRSPWLTRVVRRCGYRVCAWDGSVFDTAEPGVDVIARRVEQRLRPGAIILLHDGDGSGRDASRAQTVDALPAILDRAEERGLRSVRLGALAPEADRQPGRSPHSEHVGVWRPATAASAVSAFTTKRKETIPARRTWSRTIPSGEADTQPLKVTLGYFQETRDCLSS